MSTNCTKCSKKVSDDEDAISCTFCHNWSHAACLGVSSRQYKLLAEVENCLWFCDSHKQKIHDLLLGKTISAEKVSNEIKELKEEINNLSSNIKANQILGTYADAARSNITVNRNHVTKYTPKNGIIVSCSLSNSSSEIIERQIKEKINLLQTKTSISKLKHISRKRVFLGTSSQSDSSKLEKLIVEKLGPDYIVTQPKKNYPQLIISNIEKEYNEEELWEEIKRTNSGFTSEDKVKLMHKKTYKTKQGLPKWAFIIQAIPKTFEKLAERYINVNFNARFVREYASVTRCFNCQSYGHKASICSAPSVCSRCADNHKTAECKNKTQTFRCVNCLDYNRKNENKVSSAHSCGGAECHIQKLKVDNFKSKISYDCLPEW